jgi:hypothetical protein
VAGHREQLHTLNGCTYPVRTYHVASESDRSSAPSTSPAISARSPASRCLDTTQYIQCEIIPMRVQQRKFVVEFKSRSRQPKVSKPASIWGDTDLKAVARQVEEQSADLFAPSADGPGNVDGLSPKVEQRAPAGHAVECPAAPPEAGARLTGLPKIETPPITLISIADIEIEQSRPAEHPSIADEASPILARRSTSARLKQEAYVSLEQLDALTVENQRLKALLRQKLAAENTRLRQMLSRFS